jgi:hypothetical protein
VMLVEMASKCHGKIKKKGCWKCLGFYWIAYERTQSDLYSTKRNPCHRFCGDTQTINRLILQLIMVTGLQRETCFFYALRCFV